MADDALHILVKINSDAAEAKAVAGELDALTEKARRSSEGAGELGHLLEDAFDPKKLALEAVGNGLEKLIEHMAELKRAAEEAAEAQTKAFETSLAQTHELAEVTNKFQTDYAAFQKEMANPANNGIAKSLEVALGQIKLVEQEAEKLAKQMGAAAGDLEKLKAGASDEEAAEIERAAQAAKDKEAYYAEIVPELESRARSAALDAKRFEQLSPAIKTALRKQLDDANAKVADNHKFTTDNEEFLKAQSEPSIIAAQTKVVENARRLEAAAIRERNDIQQKIRNLEQQGIELRKTSTEMEGRLKEAKGNLKSSHEVAVDLSERDESAQEGVRTRRSDEAISKAQGAGLDLGQIRALISALDRLHEGIATAKDFATIKGDVGTMRAAGLTGQQATAVETGLMKYHETILTVLSKMSEQIAHAAAP